MHAAEYLDVGESRERYELVDGVIVMSPSATPLHHKVIRLIQRQLESYAASDRGRGLEFFSEIDLRLSELCVYRPDVVCYRAGRLAVLPDRLELPPDLIVEILSPGTKAFDLTTKRDDYEHFGVLEYWAYDPADGRCWCYRRAEGQDAPLSEIPVKEESLRSSALPGFTLELTPLRDVRRG